MDKIAERLEQITLFLQKFDPTFGAKKGFQITPLSRKEERVFQALYALLQEQPCVTYRVLAAKLGFSENLAKNYIVNLVEKGIPIKKFIVDKRAQVALDREFMQRQAKENLIGKTVPLSYWGLRA